MPRADGPVIVLRAQMSVFTLCTGPDVTGCQQPCPVIVALNVEDWRPSPERKRGVWA